MNYETPLLNDAMESYETPSLLDVEEVAGLTAGCFTAGFSFDLEAA